MSDWKDESQVLGGLVDEGLYVDNLREMLRKSAQLIVSSEYPTAFYVLESVFSELKQAWDDRPVTTEEYERVQGRLVGLIQDVLVAARSGEGDALRECLDILVQGFVEMRSDL